MGINTYTTDSLVTTMSRYTRRMLTADYDVDTGAIAYIILAKRRMDEVLRAREMITTVTLSDTDFPYTLPDDYLEMITLTLTGNNPVTLRPTDNNSVVVRATAEAGNQPQIWEITGTTLSIAPGPRTGDAFSLKYYARPDEALGGTDSNIYFNKFLQVILAGALEEFYLSILDHERAAFWGGLFNQRLAEAVMRENMQKYSGYPVTVRNV